MDLSEKLKKLRTRAKKTLKEASDVLNVSLNTVYRWEHGLSTPRKSVLKKAAGYYSVPLEWLLAEDGEQDFRNIGHILQPETAAEHQIVEMLKVLSERAKYRVVGYIERICEEIEEI